MKLLLVPCELNIKKTYMSCKFEICQFHPRYIFKTKKIQIEDFMFIKLKMFNYDGGFVFTFRIPKGKVGIRIFFSIMIMQE